MNTGRHDESNGVKCYSSHLQMHDVIVYYVMQKWNLECNFAGRKIRAKL